MSNKIFPTDTVAKSPLVAADLFLIADSADSNKVKDITGAVLNTFVRGAGGSIVMATGNTIGIASGGNITFTDATVDLISILAAAVKIGNGTPTQTQAAEDLYVEGKLEVDGILYADAGLTVLAGQAITDGVFSVTSGVFTAIASLTVDDITINGNAISSAGASSMTIVPTAGQLLILDGHWGFDGTGMTAQTDADTILTAYAGKKITIESVSFDGGVMAGVVSITDGTASWASSSLSGFTSVSGTTLTDGVASLNAGSLAALVNLTLGSATVNAGVFSMIQGATASDPTFSITQTGNDVAIAQTVGKMNLTAVGEVVINDGSADVNFRVESDGNANALVVDAGLNAVLIGYGNGVDANTDFGVFGSGATNYLFCDFINYSADAGYYPLLRIIKSHTNTLGTLTETIDTEVLGVITFRGVDNTSVVDNGALITAKQDGAAGTRVPTNLIFETYSATAINTNQLVLHNDGNIGLGTDAPTVRLDVRGGAIFNEDSGDYDFRIESNGLTHAFFIDAGDDKICIGHSAPATFFHVFKNISGLGSQTIATFGANTGQAVNDETCIDINSGATPASGGCAKIGGLCLNATGGARETALTLYYDKQGSGQVEAMRMSTAGVVVNEGGLDLDFRVESDGNANMLVVDGGLNAVGIGTAAISGFALAVAGTIVPSADDTYYLGKNDDDTPLAWKGVIVKDTTNGTYYRVEVINGTVTATALTD